MSPQRSLGRRGQAMVFILLTATFSFLMAGLAVDFLWAYVVKSRLVMAVDASALAAVRALGRGDIAMNRTVSLVFETNFPSDYMLAKGVNFTPPVVSTPEPGIRDVFLSGEAIAPTFFMRILGFNSLEVSASATASRRDVNMMLVLDRSASLHPDLANAWGDVQEAAIFFVEQFDDARDKLGVVTFGTGAHVDRALSTNFKSSVTSAINSQVVARSASTNSPQGLWLAYAELLRVSDPNPINAIVFFTDGQPSSYTASFAVSTTRNYSNNSIPYCNSSPKTAVIGALQDAASGAFYEVNGFWNPNADGPPVTTGYSSGYTYDHFVVSGCNSPNGVFTPWASDTEWLFDSGSCLPNSWTATYGSITRNFSITSGPYSVNQCSSYLKSTSTNWSQRTYRGEQVHNAAKNLTVNIAQAARQNTSLGEVRIYSIGLGGWGYPADAGFLRQVANDPQSPTFTTDEPQGIYVYAPSKLQLRAAFNTVASEIFRLIR
ncbi:MAG: VWA domain-containing protein [Acidobacteria bacterium]|nr:VWA domain-containing protein [Acidobacteriota bacterium]